MRSFSAASSGSGGRGAGDGVMEGGRAEPKSASIAADDNVDDIVSPRPSKLSGLSVRRRGAAESLSGGTSAEAAAAASEAAAGPSRGPNIVSTWPSTMRLEARRRSERLMSVSWLS